MSKFENIEKKDNKDKNDLNEEKLVAEKNINKVENKKPSVGEPEKKVVIENKKEIEIKPGNIQSTNIHIPNYVESYQNVKSGEPQFIVLNQMMPDETDKNKKQKQDEIIDINEISRELLRYRKEYSKYTFAEIEEKSKIFSNWFNRREYYVHKKSNSVFAESFKIIRNNILIKAKEKNIKTILITSTSPTDGKSLIASNLSISIARNFDKYLLLVDTDFRKPTLHNYFNFDRKPGLSDYLINNQLSFDKIVKKTNWPKLSVIPVGSYYENSSEILSSKIMNLFIKEIKYRYDDRLIIFDSPPINISDAVAISDMVDGIVIVVRAGKTDKRILDNTIENIDKNKLIGIVLNFGKVNTKDYYSYY